MSKNFKIGVENFRVFKEMTEFDLRPLTILVGPNNSGKSSFTKLLLLLKNGFNPLNFKKGDHHLGSYKKSLNWDTESNEMVLRNEATYLLSSDQFTEELRFNKNGIHEKIIINNKTGQYLLNSIFLGSINAKAQLDSFSLDINYIIDLLYDKQILVKSPSSEDDLNNSNFQTVPLKVFESFAQKNKIALQKFGPYLFENQYLHNHSQPENEFQEALILNSILINEISELEKDYLLCDVIVNSNKVYDKDKVLELQNLIFNNWDLDPHSATIESLESFMNNIFTSFQTRLKRKCKEELDLSSFGKYEETIIEVKPTILGRLIFTENLFDDGSLFFRNYFSTTLFDRFKSQMFTRLNVLKRVKYIPANRGNQSRILLAEQNISTYEGVSDYHATLHKEREYIPIHEILDDVPAPSILLKSMLEIIGITGKITTKHFEDTAAVVYIERKGKEINLADYGFGYSQLIPIILKIYNLSYDSSFGSIIIIEEPEANLHPNLQAKFADILSLVIKFNPSWKVIIETHSEYLIRKLQYLVAKKEIERESCIIYYFNVDENVSIEEPKVKPIEINDEGNLTDNFGPGFYDEATRLQFDLLKLNRTQSN